MLLAAARQEVNGQKAPQIPVPKATPPKPVVAKKEGSASKVSPTWLSSQTFVIISSWYSNVLKVQWGVAWMGQSKRILLAIRPLPTGLATRDVSGFWIVHKATNHEEFKKIHWKSCAYSFFPYPLLLSLQASALKTPFCNACRRLVMDRVAVFLVFHPHPAIDPAA